MRRATGMIRRLDGLGRIVIPKEIRKTMHIIEGDSLEIFVEATGEIILKKYSTIGELGGVAQLYAQMLSKSTNCPVLITDRERVVAMAKLKDEGVIGKNVTREFDKLMQGRQEISNKDKSVTYPIQGLDWKALAGIPIIINGDLGGSVILLEDGENTANECHMMIARFVAQLFGQVSEE